MAPRWTRKLWVAAGLDWLVDGCRASTRCGMKCLSDPRMDAIIDEVNPQCPEEDREKILSYAGQVFERELELPTNKRRKRKLRAEQEAFF